MVKREHWDKQLEASAKERELHLLVEQLAGCGVRPKMSYQLLGRMLSFNEIKRINALTSPLGPSAQHGRLINPGTVAKFSPEANAAAIEAIDMMVLARSQGAHQADALCAAWRILTEARGLAPYSDIEGIGCEDLAIIWVNLQARELTIHTCGCGTRFVRLQRDSCQKCDPIATKKSAKREVKAA